jgi:hypothetical protein
MKRKQAADGEDGDDDNNIRPTTRAFAESAPTLTNLPDVLLVSVLSFLDFGERSKVRPVCRRLLHSVDSMPAPSDLTLKILLVPASSLAGRPWTVSWDNGRALVEMRVNNCLAVSTFPLVKSIRPTRLKVEPHDEEEGKVDAGLIHCLATQVAKTVTKLSIMKLHASSIIELQESLGRFDEEGDGITELQLCTCHPLMHTMSAILRLRKLRGLYLYLRKEMLEGWSHNPLSFGLQFAALSALPDLEELTVRKVDDDAFTDDHVLTGIMLGYSEIPQLRRVSSTFLVEWSDEDDEDIRDAFATMLHRLTDLESLSLLQYPSADLWEKVHAIGGHRKLQELVVYFSGDSLEVYEALASACNEDFPALRQLEIHFNYIKFFEVNDIVRALARLSTHPSLSTIKCSWGYWCDEADFFSGCREVLGDNIEVVEIPHYDSGDYEQHML